MLLGQVPEAVVWAIYFAPVASTLLITAGLIARRLFGFAFRDEWAGQLTILALVVACEQIDGIEIARRNPFAQRCRSQCGHARARRPRGWS